MKTSLIWITLRLPISPKSRDRRERPYQLFYPIAQGSFQPSWIPVSKGRMLLNHTPTLRSEKSRTRKLLLLHHLMKWDQTIFPKSHDWWERTNQKIYLIPQEPSQSELDVYHVYILLRTFYKKKIMSCSVSMFYSFSWQCTYSQIE